MGAIARQGPHHVAQKSTRTGLSDFKTSWSKFASVTSTIPLPAIFFLLVVKRRPIGGRCIELALPGLTILMIAPVGGRCATFMVALDLDAGGVAKVANRAVGREMPVER